MARYRELTRGAIVGDSYGMLKLLVSTEDRTLLGVHVFGTNATDLVHIGRPSWVAAARSAERRTAPSNSAQQRARNVRVSGHCILGHR